MMNRFTSQILLALILIATSTASGAADDAAALYMRAAKAIVAECPAASNYDFPPFPPFGPDWDRVARAAWEQNGEARRLAHNAASSDHADWPGGMKYLNSMRALANDLGDAALYQHLQLHDDAGACRTLTDVIHLPAMLRRPAGTSPTLVQDMVAEGIDALLAHRGMIIASDVALTNDAGDTHALQITDARRLIDQLLDQRDADQTLAAVIPSDHLPAGPQRDRFVETINRCNAGRTTAAVSLACHLFRFDNKRWPQSLDELVPAYLPRVPIDPWGDGKQPYGYVVIKAGLPGGWDRPLVYTRCESQDGLFYRADAPQYDFSIFDGSDRPQAKRKRGGQFRDIASWTPDPDASAGPATRPLQK
jgi:hypothetical protein